jgi:hypothetical protein
VVKGARRIGAFVPFNARDDRFANHADGGIHSADGNEKRCGSDKFGRGESGFFLRAPISSSLSACSHRASAWGRAREILDDTNGMIHHL